MILDLDPEQERASRAPETRVLVLSGAGSGKTRLLTARVQWLRGDCDVAGKEIACVTFSRAAADEMAIRLVGDSGFYPDEKVGPGGMWIGTMHALGLRILTSVFRGRTVADQAMSTRLLARALKELGASKEHKPGETLKRIAAAKSSFGDWPADIAAYCARYQELLREFRMFDFTDLIVEAVRVLEERPEVRSQWDRRFKHVLVDEVQDTSPVQWRLIRNLIRPSTFLFGVGDLGQSIYSFRGARPEYLLDDLDRMLGPWTTYALTHNYRSVPEIITVANGISAGRRGMVEIRPTREITTRPESVLATEMDYSDTEDQEAAWGVLRIQQSLAAWSALDLGDISILCRTNAQIEPFEAALVAAKIPYRVLGGFSFYERTEVADVIAWLKIATLTGDDPADRAAFFAALDRVYNRPSRYLGKVWFDSLMEQGGWEAWIQGKPFTWKLAYQARNVDALKQAIIAIRKLGAVGSACDVIRHIIDGPLGYRAWVIREGEVTKVTAEVDSLVSENLDAILHGATRFPKPRDYLDFVDLCKVRSSKRGAGGQRVTLSTIHRAKGLEWPMVILAGVIDGKLPHVLGVEDEERRLFYVGVTRAGDRLVISGSDEPSRFVADLIGDWPVWDVPHVALPPPRLALPAPAQKAFDWWTGEEVPDGEAAVSAPEGDPDRSGVQRRTGTGTVLHLVHDTSPARRGPTGSDTGTGG